MNEKYEEDVVEEKEKIVGVRSEEEVDYRFQDVKSPVKSFIYATFISVVFFLEILYCNRGNNSLGDCILPTCICIIINYGIFLSYAFILTAKQYKISYSFKEFAYGFRYFLMLFMVTLDVLVVGIIFKDKIFLISAGIFFILMTLPMFIVTIRYYKSDKKKREQLNK